MRSVTLLDQSIMKVQVIMLALLVLATFAADVVEAMSIRETKLQPNGSIIGPSLTPMTRRANPSVLELLQSCPGGSTHTADRESEMSCYVQQAQEDKLYE